MWHPSLASTKLDTFTHVSNDSLSVAWSVIGPPEPSGDTSDERAEGMQHRASGAARASRGVDSGRWYWEVEVGGSCGIVGVGQEDFDISTYPGFDGSSFGFGDAGYGGELFNDAGERSYIHSLPCLSLSLFVSFSLSPSFSLRALLHDAVISMMPFLTNFAVSTNAPRNH